MEQLVSQHHLVQNLSLFSFFFPQSCHDREGELTAVSLVNGNTIPKLLMAVWGSEPRRAVAHCRGQ